MNRYQYDGPVMGGNRCIANRWKGETIAISESKARNNLAYQFKMQNNLIPASVIILPGKIIKC